MQKFSYVCIFFFFALQELKFEFCKDKIEVESQINLQSFAQVELQFKFAFTKRPKSKSYFCAYKISRTLSTYSPKAVLNIPGLVCNTY